MVEYLQKEVTTITDQLRTLRVAIKEKKTWQTASRFNKRTQ